MDYPLAYRRVFASLGGVRSHTWGWDANCPAHDDGKRSMTLKLADDGKLLVNCHANAGCTFASIAAALGIDEREFFADNNRVQQATYKSRIVETYDYRDERGRLIYQAVRMEPKDFRQRRPDGCGGWTWNLEGVRLVPYRLPEIVAAARTRMVFVPEGEKDVERLRSLGLVATTNPLGAGKWARMDESATAVFRGRHVALLPDNDEAGEKHADDVIESLDGCAASVRVVRLPGLARKQDVSDWLRFGGTRERLIAITQATPTWRVAEILRLTGRLTADERRAVLQLIV